MGQASLAMMATILRKTELGEPLVFAYLVAVAAVVIASLRRSIRDASHNWAFWGFVGAILGAWTLLFFFNLEKLDVFSGEGHVVEWLTAQMCLMLGVVGLLIMFRQRARGEPYPLMVFLTTGCFLGLCRELQWGEPFFGEKIIYTRYLWRPAAYFGPARFRGLANEVEMIEQGISAQFLYVSFLIFVAAMIVAGIVTIGYIIRHREAFVEQAREFSKSTAGKLFIAGMSIYFAAQLMAELVEEVMEDQLEAMGTSDCIIAEPMELIATLFLMRGMIRFWHDGRFYLPGGKLRSLGADLSAASLGSALRTQQAHAPD